MELLKYLIVFPVWHLNKQKQIKNRLIFDLFLYIMYDSHQTGGLFMSYQELKKLYYGNSEKYAQEYLTRFHSDKAIQIEFQIGENQGFFLQNSEVLTLAFRIAKLDKEIGKLCDALPGIATNQYSKKCLIDEIVITNKIEGVHSSRKEIGEALDVLEAQSKSKGKHQRFISLVNKYLKLIAQEKIPLQT